MPSILPAFASIVRPSKYAVPVGPLVLDWAHPLTNGLIACYVPGVMGGVNLAGFGANLTFTAASVVPSQEGPGVDTTTSTSKLTSSSAVPAVFTNWSQASQFWHGFKYSGNFTDFPTLIGIDYDGSAGTSPYLVVGLDAVDSTPGFRIFWNNAGSQNHGSTFNLTDNVMNSAACSVTVSGNAVTYLNGLQQESVSFGTAPNSSATSQVSIGRDVTVLGGNGKHNTAIACIWTRALSTTEQLQMHLDPYGFLIPAEYDMPAINSAAAAASWGWVFDDPVAAINQSAVNVTY